MCRVLGALHASSIGLADGGMGERLTNLAALSIHHCFLELCANLYAHTVGKCAFFLFQPPLVATQQTKMQTRVYKNTRKCKHKAWMCLRTDAETQGLQVYDGPSGGLFCRYMTDLVVGYSAGI